METCRSRPRRLSPVPAPLTGPIDKKRRADGGRSGAYLLPEVVVQLEVAAVLSSSPRQGPGRIVASSPAVAWHGRSTFSARACRQGRGVAWGQGGGVPARWRQG